MTRQQHLTRALIVQCSKGDEWFVSVLCMVIFSHPWARFVHPHIDLTSRSTGFLVEAVWWMQTLTFFRRLLFVSSTDRSHVHCKSFFHVQ